MRLSEELSRRGHRDGYKN